MSKTVSKPLYSRFIYLACAVFALLTGFYATSRLQHWNATLPAFKTDTGIEIKEDTPEQRAKEYAAYKQVFLEKVKAYKTFLNQGGNVAVLGLLNEGMGRLAIIEAEYIKLRPGATEPDRIKLQKMIGQYSNIYDQLVRLDYELVSIREARADVTTVHSILLLTSPKHYAKDKDKVKAILKDADTGTFNIYQTGILKAKIDYLTEVALARLKPTEQDATREMRLQAGLQAIELYLNELTARNNPKKPAGE
ncbi:MAG: hypothetical protein SFY67_09395 [Candidatus Melainabacteria bacterium]|nr:hypothetical protein [Candidatus Melainabacteria bacterium]